MHFARLVKQASATGFCDLFVFGAYTCDHYPGCIGPYCTASLFPRGADIWWMSTEARTVGEVAVRILLECFLVQK